MIEEWDEGGSMSTATGASTTSAIWTELGDVFGVDEDGAAHDLNVTDAFLIMPWSGFADREVAAGDKGVLCVRLTAPDGTNFVFDCELQAECVGIEGDYNGDFDWNVVA